jgi:hypothetical protein
MAVITEDVLTLGERIAVAKRQALQAYAAGDEATGDTWLRKMQELCRERHFQTKVQAR